MHHTAQSHRGDVVEVFPGTFETVDMYTDNPGTWLLHCHVMTHLVDGMEAKYAILHKGGTVTFFIYIKPMHYVQIDFSVKIQTLMGQLTINLVNKCSII